MTGPGATYDLLLKGGHVVDPHNNVDERRDVAITGDRISAVERDIDPSLAGSVADVSGLHVTPGLIDIHSHHYGYSAWIFPDEYALPNGTTTVVDAGGSGWKNFDDFRRTIISRARTRVLALLNIVGGGMLGTIEQDTSEMQPYPCAEKIAENRDVLVGVKAAHHRGPGWDSVDGAVKAAELSGTFAMIDYHNHPERQYRDLLLSHMRPGDIHTHMYGQHLPQLDDNKKVHDYIWEARQRGVLFDIGHGGGSFWFRVAVPCMEQGHTPETISTDAHKGSFFLPRATMPETMSKLMNMGMTLQDAVARASSVPAQRIGRPDLGTLTPGVEADVAVFALESGDFGFIDSGFARMAGDRRLSPRMTVRSGHVAWDLNGVSRPDWKTQGDYVRLEV
ncbi:MAG: amidohydrolase family protein [Chloroflexota bacterium]